MEKLNLEFGRNYVEPFPNQRSSPPPKIPEDCTKKPGSLLGTRFSETLAFRTRSEGRTSTDVHASVFSVVETGLIDLPTVVQTDSQVVVDLIANADTHTSQ